MKYRKLGASDLTVSEISLGSWLTYGVGVEKDAAIACVDRAFALGINFIDTANVYGRGASETVLGEALAGRKRDSYVLATKVFGDMGGGNQGLSRGQIEKQLDDSLKRLRTDFVDLYQCHRYDTNTPLAETMEALTRAVKSGKVRWLGFSEWSPQNISDAIAMTGVEHFVSSQPQYSLLYRRPEAKVIPLSAANGISQIVWSPLAQGVLTGKYDPNSPPPAGTRATSDQMSSAIALDGEAGAGGGAEAEAAGAGGGADDGAVRAGLGAARAERRVGDRRREPPGAARRERGGERRQGRSGAVRPGGSYTGGGLAAALTCTWRCYRRRRFYRHGEPK